MYPEPQLYLYPTNLSIQKSCDFFPRDPAQKSCSEHMKNVQTIIPDHAKILQMLMRNTWKTMQIPWNLLLLNGCGWSYIILKYVTLMHTHWNSRQTPPANPICCNLIALSFNIAVAQPYARSQTQAGSMNQQTSATYIEGYRSMVSIFLLRLLDRP